MVYRSLFIPSRNFYLNLLCNSSTLQHLNQIQTQVITQGLHQDLITTTKLCIRFSDLGAIDRTHLLFSTISHPDLFLFNVLIKGYSSNNLHACAISVYHRLFHHSTLKPDNFTFAFVISSSSYLESSSIGRLIHAHAVVNGYDQNCFVGSTISDFYLKFSQVQMAWKALDRILYPDTVCWNTVISGLVWNCYFDDAILAFEKMILGGITLDSTTIAAILPAIAELFELDFGKQIHCLSLKKGFETNRRVITGFISLYSKSGDVPSSELLFSQISHLDLVAWNAMISGYSCNDHVDSSVTTFRKCLNDGYSINSSTIVGLIPVCSPFGHAKLSESIHGLAIKVGVHSNPAVSTALTTVYARLNEIETARQLFDEATAKSLASWNAMISGYAQNGLIEDAILLFREMQKQEIQPNPVTFTSIISACAQLGSVRLGKWVHELALGGNFGSNIYVSTALIDMYAKCGCIIDARKIFDEMSTRNVVSWNTIISAYGLHGHGHEALKLFSEMEIQGVSPNGVTFLSLLYACSHAGLVQEGKRVFHSMSKEYGIDPIPEHYACMVDLLSRAGQLNEALNFINTIPGKPGSGVWSTLLGACMKYRNTSIAQIASEELFKHDQESVGYYVLLSNLHSTDKNYIEAAQVRLAAKRKKLIKVPGCSLVEIGETAHVFTSGDRSHPMSEAIYAELRQLIGKIKDAGFQTEIDVAFYDVEEEEKEHMVNVHSEKLAIAFGIISSEPGKEIRIIKNLRVCLDCHNATKFISKITKRKIIVRDANRFHHFTDGSCSCGDYW